MLFVVAVIMFLSSAWTEDIPAPSGLRPCKPDINNFEGLTHSEELAKLAFQTLANSGESSEETAGLYSEFDHRVSTGGSASRDALISMCETISRQDKVTNYPRYGCANKGCVVYGKDRHCVLCYFGGN